jgi:GTP cyclohydrolase I/GTP cyclohydrolase-4
VKAHARRRLRDDDFSEDQIERVFEHVPVATHNQRGLGTLHIGCLEECDAEIDASSLLEIVESSMSSEIYELMKRSDEVDVVEKAHLNPRFVEDCVREMISGVIGRYPELDGGSFVSARQENLETIQVALRVAVERHARTSDVDRRVARRRWALAAVSKGAHRALAAFVAPSLWEARSCPGS